MIDDALKTFLETGGCAVVVGTRDAALAPEITRAWGIRILDPRTVELCLGMPSSARTLENLNENGQLAVTSVSPMDYRQVQLKGRATETLAPNDEDRAQVAQHQRAFMRQVEHVGLGAEQCRLFWTQDDADAMVKLRFVVDEAYDQTPGPDAGRPL
jgi:hypothetical protein